MTSRRKQYIRLQVDEVCKALYKMCEDLTAAQDEVKLVTTQSLSINEIDQLLSGFKSLFERSNNIEQIRLLTIAPMDWGRPKMEKWFGCTERQARQALLLRDQSGILSYPKDSRGNKSLDDETKKKVVEFFLKEGLLLCLECNAPLSIT